MSASWRWTAGEKPPCGVSHNWLTDTRWEYITTSVSGSVGRKTHHTLRTPRTNLPWGWTGDALVVPTLIQAESDLRSRLVIFFPHQNHLNLLARCWASLPGRHQAKWTGIFFVKI